MSLYSPFVVSPSTAQPFVLSRSKETAEMLRDRPFDKLRVNGECEEVLDARH